jgi:hypothetical protein
LALLHDCIAKNFDQVREALRKRFPQFDLQALSDAVTFRKGATFPIGKPLAKPVDAAPSPDIPPHSTPQQQQAVTGKFCGDLKWELQQSAEAVIAKTEQLYTAMAINLEAEATRRRKAEAEARALRLELESLRRRYVGDIDSSPPGSDIAAAATPLPLPSSSSSLSLSTEESARKREILGAIEEIHGMLDDLRRRADSSSDVHDVIFVGKLVRELHTFVQMPLGKQPELKAIPKQFEVTGMTAEKIRPLRMATQKAIGEVRVHIEKLSGELGSLFHLIDLDQRICDISAMLQQKPSHRKV